MLGCTMLSRSGGFFYPMTILTTKCDSRAAHSFPENFSRQKGFKPAAKLRIGAMKGSTSQPNKVQSHNKVSTARFKRQEKKALVTAQDCTATGDFLAVSWEGYVRDSNKPLHFHHFKDSFKEKHEMVYGLSPCLLAITGGRRKLSKLYIKDGESHHDTVQQVTEEAIKRNVKIAWVQKRDLDRMTQGRVHQGICLQASRLKYLRECFVKPQSVRDYKNKPPLWLVLDGIQDPMNLGAVLRSAYFLGVDRIACSLQNSCPLTPVVSKASAGIMEVMDIFGYDNLEDLIKVQKENGWQVVGTLGVKAQVSEVPIVPCSDFHMEQATMLLMGGEGTGLSHGLRTLCDVFLTIAPHRALQPGIESLNVSVATGILLYSLLKSQNQR